MRKLLVASSCVLIGMTGFGQVPDSDELLRRIEGIGQIPLSKNFRNSYPEFFEHQDCPPQFRLAEHEPDLEFRVFDLPPDKELETNFTILLLKEDCERFTHLSALAAYYLPVVDAVIDSLGLPQAYRYLPLAQSLFNPENEGGFYGSSVLDASRYGVKVSKEIDLRNDFYISTLSSFKRIKDLHGKLGIPELVYLAFNEGFRPVNSQFKATGNELDFFLRTLPTHQKEWLYFIEVAAGLYQLLETPDYRSAMSALASNYCEVHPKQATSRSAYAKVLQIDEQILDEMNPVFPGSKIPASAEVPFRLPADKCEKWILLEDSIYRYEQALEEQRKLEQARLEAERTANVPSGDTHVERIHVVKSGDVLGNIANRYGVRVSDIKEWNDLKRDVIYVGQKLVIYVPKSKSGRQDPKPEPEEREVEPAPDGAFVWYTVRSGDNLWLIAREFPGVSAEDIKEWNEVDENLQPGQKLKIYKRD